MKTYRGMDVYIHIFLTSALAGGEWSDSRPCRFTPGTHFIGGWVDPRSGLDNMEKRTLLPYRDSNSPTPGRAARSQSLYRQSYPGSIYIYDWPSIYIFENRNT
jgi:hypothetical protein